MQICFLCGEIWDIWDFARLVHTILSSFLPDLATLFCSCKTLLVCLFLIWQINGWLLLLLLRPVHTFPFGPFYFFKFVSNKIDKKMLQ